MIPTPQAMLIAVTLASKARATPEIKSPAIKSRIPFIKETPGSSGMMEPTTNMVGAEIILKCVSITPIKPIKEEATKLENAGMVLTSIILL